jgi:hypothetical protein
MLLHDQTTLSVFCEINSDMGRLLVLLPAGRGFGHQYINPALRYALILADERNSTGSTSHDKPHDVKFDRTPSLRRAYWDQALSIYLRHLR